jgi:hypothetical protein
LFSLLCLPSLATVLFSQILSAIACFCVVFTTSVYHNLLLCCFTTSVYHHLPLCCFQNFSLPLLASVLFSQFQSAITCLCVVFKTSVHHHLPWCCFHVFCLPPLASVLFSQLLSARFITCKSLVTLVVLIN